MQASAPATILLADDHPLFRAALRRAVGSALPGSRLVECADDSSLRSAVARNPEADLGRRGISEQTTKAHVSAAPAKRGARNTRAVLPGMRARGFGRIANIGSIHSLVASPFKSARSRGRWNIF